MKLLRDAGRAALAVVEQDMRQHAGFDEESIGPHMRDSIKIRSTNVAETSRYNTIVTLRVGPSKIHHMKAVAQEFGTVKQVADPFIRPAMDYNVQKSLKCWPQKSGWASKGVRNQERVNGRSRNQIPVRVRGTSCGYRGSLRSEGRNHYHRRASAERDGDWGNGEKGTFLEVTRLIDKEPKYMADMGEGEDKTLVFIDDPSDTVQEALLSDADAKKRWSSS